jgi:hypothetical protein
MSPASPPRSALPAGRGEKAQLTGATLTTTVLVFNSFLNQRQILWQK